MLSYSLVRNGGADGGAGVESALTQVAEVMATGRVPMNSLGDYSATYPNSESRGRC